MQEELAAQVPPATHSPEQPVMHSDQRLLSAVGRQICQLPVPGPGSAKMTLRTKELTLSTGNEHV